MTRSDLSFRKQGLCFFRNGLNVDHSDASRLSAGGEESMG